MIKIITAELVQCNLNLESEVIVVDAKDKEKLIKEMLKIKKLTDSIDIWDLTNGYTLGEIIEVSDHINKTGANPLIGNQQKLKIDFPDVTNLYNHKKGITTICRGDSFHKRNEEHISTWLCHISIVARAIGIKKIQAKLVSM